MAVVDVVQVVAVDQVAVDVPFFGHFADSTDVAELVAEHP